MDSYDPFADKRTIGGMRKEADRFFIGIPLSRILHYYQKRPIKYSVICLSLIKYEAIRCTMDKYSISQIPSYPI